MSMWTNLSTRRFAVCDTLMAFRASLATEMSAVQCLLARMTNVRHTWDLTHTLFVICSIQALTLGAECFAVPSTASHDTVTWLPAEHT